MKLGIQGWFCTQPFTGIGQHCMGLLREWSQMDSLDLRVFVPEKVRIQGVSSRLLQVIKPKWWIPHPSLRKWYWERIQVPAAMADWNPDWEIYPYPQPLPRTSPNLRSMTVHDTILWTDQRYESHWLKALYHRKARRALVAVDQVFTVSQATHDALGIPTATVVPNAVDAPKIRRKKMQPKTLVYVGGYDIRKQVPELVSAFEALHSKDPEWELQLIGEPHHHSRFYPAIPELEGVKWMGKLSEQKLYETLEQAFAFVHFSDSEGFNLPLLQAMTVGTPAIVRDLPVNREVSQNAALFLKNSLPKALSDKLKWLQKDTHRKSVVRAQTAAAKQYKWAKSAKAFLKQLRYVSRQ